jgi:glutamate carboxypeptidase
MKHLAVLLGLAVGTIGTQSSASQTERAMAAYVDAHADESIALLERAVNINSGTMNLEGVRQVGALFRAELDKLGFKTEWVDGSSWKRAGHLVARHPGAGPPLLLIGHLDTVFEKDSPFQKFERLPDGRHAKGPGIVDMKGGNVVMVLALQALKSAGLLDAMNVNVVMTGDEEAPGRPLTAARAALVAAATGAHAAMAFENGDNNPSHAVVARRGTTAWELTVTGTTGHSSQVFGPDLGAGAIYEAARILNAFRERLAGEAHLTFNPGVMLGGTSVEYDGPQSRGTAFGKTNVVAGRVMVAGDLRGLTMAQFEKAKAAMRDIVAQSLPKTKAEITFDEGYPPLAPSAGNERLLVLYDRASQDLGLGRVEAVSPDRAGAADVAFIGTDVPMVLDAVGLKGRDDHSPNETADLTTLAIQAKRAAVTIARLRKPTSGVGFNNSVPGGELLKPTPRRRFYLAPASRSRSSQSPSPAGS